MKGKQKKSYADPWKEYAKRYDKLYWAPGKPTKQEKAIFHRFIKEALKENKQKNKRALVLGATPALRDILAKFDIKVTLIDTNNGMIQAMSRLIKHRKKEIFVKGDWLNLPFSNGYFDIVVGDLVLSNIDGKNKQKFLKEINRVLKPNHHLVTRIFFVPSDWKFETTDVVLSKFAKKKSLKNKSTELLAYLLCNTYNCKTGEFFTSKIKEMLAKYRKKGKYIYPDSIKVEKLITEMYNMWKPFKKVWHSGTKKEVFSWISKQFNIIKEDYAKDHYFGKSYIIISCRAK